MFVLLWNPDSSSVDDHEFEMLQHDFSEENSLVRDWSVHRKGGVSIGDKMFLLRVKRERGIVALGTAESEIFEDEHWDGSDRIARYIDVVWQTILPVDDRMPIDVVVNVAPNTAWNSLQSSGAEVRVEDQESLLEAWYDWLVGLDVDFPANEAGVRSGAERRIVEGASKRVVVNRFERSKKAREHCIRAHGARCAVCGLDFEDMYGQIGAGHIHVHHKVPLSGAVDGSGYELDPVNDLVPVCPNCHEMLHIGVDEPRTVEELQKIIQDVAQ
ncbi:HNH endonuclease [Candidatus Poriferisodalis sp.]|uniref:HNH endonuclease n=1 Tax=Candidatus Poriferisodalis sp. TaxID=3101277 RepID=UPI003B518776